MISNNLDQIWLWKKIPTTFHRDVHWVKILMGFKWPWVRIDSSNVKESERVLFLEFLIIFTEPRLKFSTEIFIWSNCTLYHSIVVSQLAYVFIEMKWHRFLCLKFVDSQIAPAILTIWLLSELLSCVWSPHGHILLRVLDPFGVIVPTPRATFRNSLWNAINRVCL